MKTRIALSTPITRSGRVRQAEGIFELPPSERSDVVLDVNLPIEDRDWNIGLIVGPSGSGKSTVARELFGDALVRAWRWPKDKSILDAFPDGLSIKDITELLSSVGFSSPPAWLRPYHVLSNGEQFRVAIAHALAERRDITVIDEFTSVVDRTVAKVGSAAIARVVRQRKQQFIAISCHFDIIEWLDPDWIFEPHLNRFSWRLLQGRPTIAVRVFRVDKETWQLFRHTHYLDSDLNPAAHCYCAYVEGVPAAFLAVLPFPHALRPGWRLHRLVCLPDFQGIGLGVKLSDYVSGVYRATGKPVFRTLSHPAVIRHCAKSPVWKMIRPPSRTANIGKTGISGMQKTAATQRLTAGFEYVGVSHHEDAFRFGLTTKGE